MTSTGNLASYSVLVKSLVSERTHYLTKPTQSYQQPGDYYRKLEQSNGTGVEHGSPGFSFGTRPTLRLSKHCTRGGRKTVTS